MSTSDKLQWQFWCKLRLLSLLTFAELRKVVTVSVSGERHGRIRRKWVAVKTRLDTTGNKGAITSNLCLTIKGVRFNCLNEILAICRILIQFGGNRCWNRSTYKLCVLWRGYDSIHSLLFAIMMRLAAFNAKCEGHPKGFVNFIFHKKSNENVKKYVKQKVNYPQTKTRHINRTFYSATSLNLYWNSFAKPINRIKRSFSGLFLFQRSRTIPINW